MADFTLTSARFPEGTSVGAYPVTNWPNSIVVTSAAPVGSATDSQTVTSGELTFTGLSEDDRYVAYALVGSAHVYVNFVAGADGFPPILDGFTRADAADLGADWSTNCGTDPGGAPPGHELLSNTMHNPGEADLANGWRGALYVAQTITVPFVAAIDCLDDYINVSAAAGSRQIYFEWGPVNAAPVANMRGFGIGLYADGAVYVDDFGNTTVEAYQYAGSGTTLTFDTYHDRPVVAGTGLAFGYDGETYRAWLRPPGSGWELLVEHATTLWAAQDWAVGLSSYANPAQTVTASFDNFRLGTGLEPSAEES